MNSKKAKKLKKYARQEVNKNLGAGFEALNKIIRQRPKWIPKRIWVLVYIPLFPRKYRGLIYKHID